MIEVGLTKEELMDSIQAVEDGLFSAKECFENIMVFSRESK